MYASKGVQGDRECREALVTMFIEGFQSTILVLRCQVMIFLKTNNFNFQQYCLQTHGSVKKLFDKAKNGDILAQQDLGLAYYEGGDFLPKGKPVVSPTSRFAYTDVDSPT